MTADYHSDPHSIVEVLQGLLKNQVFLDKKIKEENMIHRFRTNRTVGYQEQDILDCSLAIEKIGLMLL